MMTTQNKTQPVNFIQAMKLFYTRAFDYSGRSSLSEYWWSVLGALLIMTIPTMLFAWAGSNADTTTGNLWLVMVPEAWHNALIWTGIFIIAFVMAVVPMMGLIVRRFHDVGLSTWWGVLLGIVPYVVNASQIFRRNGIVLIVILIASMLDLYIICKPSVSGR